MAKDINKQPYDEATLTKLEIFEGFLGEWLPVFIHDQFTTKVMVCDFFAGSGQDSEGVPGSSLRILQVIEKFRDQILENDISIDVVLNEAAVNKYNELQTLITSKFDPASWQNKISISIHNEKFQELFQDKYEQLKEQPNLLFIDQYGVKEVTDGIFQMLIGLEKTDFLFFISSSAIKRFAVTPKFQIHLPDIDPIQIAEAKHEDIHRIIKEHYENKIPKGNGTQLYPYTLKKGANIYGLIFGSKHPLGVEKFLDLAWGKNQINGQANFDIDNDMQKKQYVLYEELKRLTKRQKFEADLEEFILSREQVTNREVYHFTLGKGHPKSHAKECVQLLRKSGKVEYKGKIGFSYKSCVKNDPKVIKVIKARNNG